MSVAETIYGAFLLRNEIEEAQAKGEWVRDVRFVRFTGANHYVSHHNLSFFRSPSLNVPDYLID